MQDPVPSVTVIVPTRPGQADVPAVTAARSFQHSPGQLEIIIARGCQPAVQRNAALRAARGEWIYFLDDDAVAPPDNLERARRHFADPTVVMVGGPNLCPPDAPALERVFAVVLSSWLAFGPSRARYAAVGNVRATGEKELILCNLMARRQAILDLGGFDESLYPNEENALMDGVQQRGGRMIYDPAFLVHRRPRPTFRAFRKMLLNYGRGRAEQFRLHPTPGSILNFVPPLFCLYLLALAPLAFTPLRIWAAAPLILYATAVAGQTLWSAASHGPLRALLAAPLVVLTHLCYGLGFWRGLCTQVPASHARSQVEVTLEHVSL